MFPRQMHDQVLAPLHLTQHKHANPHLQPCNNIDNNANDLVLDHELVICWEKAANSNPCQASQKSNALE